MRSLDKTSPERNPTETAPETGWFLPACLVASIALPALLHQRTSDDLELKWLSFWIATFPLALWICLPKTPRHPISISRICGVLLLTGLPALSGLWSHHPPIALARAATLTPLAVLLFTGSFLSSHPLARSRTTMGLVVLGGLTGFWIGLDPTHALPLGNTNHAGLFCALCLPLILAPGRLLSRTGSAWIFAEFILRGFALVGLSWGLIAAGSKGAWVGAAAGIWVVSGIALWRHPRGRKIGIPALLGFMVLLLCAPPVHEFLSGQLGKTFFDSDSSEREEPSSETQDNSDGTIEFREDGQLEVEVDLPGVQRRDLLIALEGDRLYIRARRGQRRYRKTLDLPHGPWGDFEQSLEDGVLTLRIAPADKD